MDGGRERNGGAGANNASARPLTGEEFGEWSDQLRDIEEMSTNDVATLLDTTENAVKIRLHRARQALRGLLAERFGSAPQPHGAAR